MNINCTNNPINFSARIDETFINSAQKLYSNRSHLRRFNNRVQEIGNYGNSSSNLVYKKFYNEHLLCLENPSLNKNGAAIIKRSPVFLDILNTFNELSDNVIKFYESILRNS